MLELGRGRYRRARPAKTRKECENQQQEVGRHVIWILGKLKGGTVAGT